MKKLFGMLSCFFLIVCLVMMVSSCDKVSGIPGVEPDDGDNGSSPDGNHAPETTITSGPTGTINERSATFTWTGQDDQDPPSQLTYSYKMDNAQWTAFTADTMKTFRGLSDGGHTFMVKARDTKGLVDPSPAMASFTVSDSGTSSAPDTEILAAPPQNSTSDTATFQWTGYDDNHPASALTYSYKLDGAAWTGFSAVTSMTFTGLTSGSHTFQVKAKNPDELEDPTPAVWAWIVTLDTKGVKLSAASTTMEVNAGGFVLFDCTITNTGTLGDTFRVTLDNSTLPAGWIANLCKDGICYADNKYDFTLGPGLSDTFEPDASPAFTASPGETGIITLNAVSLTDPSVTDTLVLTIRVK